MKEKRPFTPSDDLELRNYMSEMAKIFNTDISDDNPVSKYLPSFNQLYSNFEDVFKKNQQLMKNIQELEQKISNNANFIRESFKQTDNILVQMHESRIQYHNALERIEDVKGRNISIQGEIEFLHERINSLMKSLKASDDADDLRRENVNLKKEVMSQIVEIDELKSTIFNAKDKLFDINSFNGKLNKQCMIFEEKSDNSKLFDFFISAKSQTGKLKQEIADMKNKVKQLTDAICLKKECNMELKRKKENDLLTLTETRCKSEKIANMIKKLSTDRVINEKKMDKVKISIDEIKRKVELLERTKIKYIEDLEAVEKLCEHNIETLGEARAKHAECKDDIVSTSDRVLELKKEKTKLEIVLNSKDLEVSSLHRHVTAETKEHQEAQIQLSNEIAETSVQAREVKFVYDSATDTKRVNNEHMTQIHQLTKEILQHVQTKGQIEQETRSCEFMNQERVELTQQLSKDLLTIRNKIHSQRDMNTALKNDSDYIKKQLLTFEESNRILMNDIRKTNTSIEATISQIDRLLTSIGKTICIKNSTGEANDHISDIIMHVQQGISDSERTSLSLLSEGKAIDRVCQEINRDINALRKESSFISSKNNLVEKSVKEKEKLIDSLNTEISDIRNVLANSSIKYREKIEEIMKLTEDLSYFNHNLEESEAKKQYMLDLMTKVSKLETSLFDEKLKRSTVICELATPRNVHRYRLYEISDPNYAKNLKLHWRITGELFDADRELESLRNELKSIRTTEKESECMTMEVYESQVRVLKEAIEQKDKEIEELQKAQMESDTEVHSARASTDAIRAKIASRKAETNALRRQNTGLLATERRPIVPPIEGLSSRAPRHVCNIVSARAPNPKPLIYFPVSGRTPRLIN